MVKKSNFDSFHKVILYSLPVVGLSMIYFYTILLPLLVALANISQTWSFLKRAYFSSNLFATKKVLPNKNDSFFNVGNFLETLQVLNFKLQIRPEVRISNLQVLKSSQNFVKNLKFALTFCFLQIRKGSNG